MNNLSSYCGLVDASIRGSDKDLPVKADIGKSIWHNQYVLNIFKYCLDAPLAFPVLVNCPQAE